MIIKNDNTLWAVGTDSWSKQGDGNTSNADHDIFYQITTGINYVDSVYAGNNHTFIVDTEGKCYGAGANTQGQLGLGSKDGDRHGIFSVVSLEEPVL
jgi:alpha-tubulin suppressor-like RCC1 family protein